MWLGTFADLMSLLMCFFVLLLAFAEMDVVKFEQIAGSMKYAFGVQTQIKVKDIPKGTSVIALEFRPGRPEPTPIEVINQVSDEKPEFSTSDEPTRNDTSGGVEKQPGDQKGGQTPSIGEDSEMDSAASSQNKASEQMQAAINAQKIETSSVKEKGSQETSTQEEVNAKAKKLAEKLRKEIVDGALELESLGQQIIIRIREKGAFASGSGFLQPRFKPIIQNVGKLLKDVPGIITVSGYTDDVRISNELYSSNWDLSSKRAVAVAQELVKVNGFNPRRMKVVGMAYNNPLVPNTSMKNRMRNRRVEIAVMQGKAKQTEEISVNE